MTSAVVTVGPKLQKLLPLLASDRDGEVVATAAAITRTLKQAGADWHDLADLLGRAEPPAQYAVDNMGDPLAWGDRAEIEQARWLAEMRISHRLSQWERDFASSISAQVKLGLWRGLSAKQIAILSRCLSKITAEAR